MEGTGADHPFSQPAGQPVNPDVPAERETTQDQRIAELESELAALRGRPDPLSPSPEAPQGIAADTSPPYGDDAGPEPVTSSIRRGDLVQITRQTDPAGNPTVLQLAIVTDHHKVAGDDVYEIYELPASTLRDVRPGSGVGEIQEMNTDAIEAENQPATSEPSPPTA